MWTEAVGWVATIITIIGVVAPQRHKLHEYQMFANILWGVYGYLLASSSLIFVSLFLIVLHLRMRGKTKNEAEGQNL